VSERSRQTTEEESVEKEYPSPDPSPAGGGESGVLPEPTPGSARKREQSSLLEMLFREAEIIAQNLKESGTRR